MKKILTSGDSVNSEAKENWITVARDYLQTTEFNLLDNLRSLNFHSSDKYYFSGPPANVFINDKSEIDDNALVYLCIPALTNALGNSFNQLSMIDKFKIYLDFQKVHQSAWKSTKH